MQITFETDKFDRSYGDKYLTNVMHYLKRVGCITEDRYPSVEKVTCRTPSATLRYCRYFASMGVTPETERVFLKNPELGVRYLRMVGKREFSDPDVQRRFRRKFKTNARVAYQWAKSFNTRLSEEEEEVFRKDMASARDYARDVIKGKFPEKVHGMLMLASYQDLSSWQKKCLADYLRIVETTGKSPTTKV